MMATYAAKADSFVPDKPRLWSEKPLANLGIIGFSPYDLAPEGAKVTTVKVADAVFPVPASIDVTAPVTLFFAPLEVPVTLTAMVHVALAARVPYVGASAMVQTSEFVRKQIEAMKSDVFELGLFRLANPADRRDAEMLPRAWDSETLLRFVPQRNR